MQLRESNFEEGGVERELSSFFSGIAGDAQSIGVLEVGVGDLKAAQKAFADAITYYRRSAEEDAIALHSARQRMQGMYTALLAGEKTALVGLAESMQRLATEEDCDPDNQWADRYYLAWCLAGAVLNDADDAAVAGLKTVNESKPAPHADYGRAVLLVGRGIRDDDLATIEAGIEAMVSFHEQDMHEDDVVDQIMSVQATALLILARALGYSPTVSSRFIPEDLVGASLSSLDL